ncbi:MAG: serine/threonine protein kinase [Planctomycetes bacterium]|nr:serine/threonine protein kinase [Planctomycetota bacterium]
MTQAGTQQRCPKCGDALGAGGACARCLLGLGLGGDSGPDLFVTGAKESTPPPAPEELAPFFPQYELVELIGRGGMGAVYKAVQKGLQRTVAIKVLPADAAADPTFAERFTREGRALARLDHPNIVGIHDSGVAGGLYYFVMEFVDGANLRQMVRAGKVEPVQALGIVSQVCEALQYAHEEGIVHRDIKPENILVDRRGRVKIADFGLAKLLGAAQTDLNLTRTQQAMGTPHYMAPEQWEKPAEVDHRADIYALGVVFYELLTGELPLGRFAPPSHKLQVDVKVDEVVLKSLAKEPALRYQSAGAVRTDVDRIAAEPYVSPREAPRRGCVGGLFHAFTFAFNPSPKPRKKLYGMELASNWIPVGLATFLWYSAWLTGSSFLFLASLVGTILIVRNIK